MTDVLLIGGGGREHAIAWKLRQSRKLGALTVAPGNGGIAQIADMAPLAIPKPGASQSELDAFFAEAIRMAKERRAELVVIGPDDPLVFGLTDAFEAAGFSVFGPSKAAAQLEGSKSFAKGVMERHGIPMGGCARFDDFAKARDYVESRHGEVVVKADGMALGKGTIVPASLDEAIEALRSLLVAGTLGASGRTVVVEDKLTGPETSAMAFSDGKTVAHMPFSCDHKPIFDGNRGPNTGGMGVYAPPSWLSEADAAFIRRDVTEAAITAMADEGTPFKGVLYPGMMMTPEGPRVIEFNARFGDPECEALLPLLDSDLLGIMQGVVDGTLDKVDVAWSDRAAVTVMLASAGYPGAYETGKPISGLDDVDRDVIVFHAATKIDGGADVVTAGGRVLAVTAVADTLEQARAKAYDNAKRIHFDGVYCRSDIGANATAVPA